MQERADFIVVGSGIAGLRAALELAPHGKVVILTKSRADNSSTQYAQGGIAAALGADDDPSLHFQDTLTAGDGLCHEEAVWALVTEGPLRVRELLEWGTRFDREEGELCLTQEAAHSRRRILHAGGDATGREINRTLIERLQGRDNLLLKAETFVLDLLVSGGRCVGVCYQEEKGGRVGRILADRVLLATGGLGMLYRDTTNPGVATGDGYAMALRAGAALMDMEFVQFHPTALKLQGAPRFLISEAVRGEGARLLDPQGRPFMKRYHPLGDLAPRDVVSRAAFREAQAHQTEHVFLDATALDRSFLMRRFPLIFQTCAHYGLDMSKDWIPVFPAAHYMMGGVLTDCWGRTTLPGLWAAGEVACNGLHGANRLASNSLLEGLVFGARAGRSMLEPPAGAFIAPRRLLERQQWEEVSSRETASLEKIQACMSELVGIVRNGPGLSKAREHFQQWKCPPGGGRRRGEVANLLLNARLVSVSALARRESRGGHYRLDFPARDDERWRCHLVLRLHPRENELLVETWRGGEDSSGEGAAEPSLSRSWQERL